MLKNKKIFIIILSAILLITVIAIASLFLLGKKDNKVEEVVLTKEQLQTNFQSIFDNKEYSTNKENIVSLALDFNKSEEGKYDIKANFPKINIENENVEEINEEIINIFGEKILDIINNNTSYTKYNLDYATFINNDILSLVLKVDLKDGNNPKRTMIQTYNYDIQNNKFVSLEELIKIKNLNKHEIQTEIINEVRKKSENAKTFAEQGYNIFVRDIRSDEYLIENISNYFLGENGYLYIVFAYGNKNYTDTVDVILFY